MCTGFSQCCKVSLVEQLVILTIPSLSFCREFHDGCNAATFTLCGSVRFSTASAAVHRAEPPVHEPVRCAVTNFGRGTVARQPQFLRRLGLRKCADMHE